VKHPLLAELACALVVCAAHPAQAQVPDVFKSILPGLKQTPPVATPPANPVPAEAAPASRQKSDGQIRSELSPDITCSRPRERFNVAEKVAEYGGTAATLRLQRMVSSDLRFSDLSAEDRRLLDYLAATTVWVPVEVESKLGAVYDTATGTFGSRPNVTELQREELAEIDRRLTRLRGAVADYPAEIRLTVNPQLADGAFARLGGMIQLSTGFLNGLRDTKEGADFLLAHEVSHVYKRHAVKQLQYRLVSTSEGWTLAKKLLQRALRGTQVDMIGDGVFLLTTVPQLIEFVRSTQIKFGREQELEADACSTVWLAAIQTDPYKAWVLFHETLGANNTSYSLEHPTHEERELRFKQKVAGTPSGSGSKGTDKGTVTKGGQQLIDDARRKKNP